MMSAAAIACAAPAWAQTDGTFRGTLECGRLAHTAQPLSIAATLTVAGGRARFERTVLHPQSNLSIGTESGRGRVGAGGQLIIRSFWRGQRDSLRGTYTGRLTAAGGEFRGRQSVSYERRIQSRSCTLTLRR